MSIYIKYIVFIVEVEGLIAKLTLRPNAEMLIRVNAEAIGRGINERLIINPETEMIQNILRRHEKTRC